MPTKKKRVGFIPRNDVFEIINKLSFENNLSISKIINILVEEALYKRGIFNIKTGKATKNKDWLSLENENNLTIGNNKDGLLNKFKNNFINNENLRQNEVKEDILDSEIYEKFLIFLKFQEKMKARTNN